MTTPSEQSDTRAIRFAVSAGTLTPARIQALEAEAQRQGVGLLAVLSEAELLHLQLIQKTLPPGATWADSIATIHRCGAAAARCSG